jgi:hypothetical protein
MLTVNPLVAGSSPARGAIHNHNSPLSAFLSGRDLANLAGCSEAAVRLLTYSIS